MAKSKNYEEFVEKFKPKKTTDDCYTPPIVYEAVKNWAIKDRGWEGRPIVRPFYPGGDFEHFDYPTDCVVIDNPPFSILSKILRFYGERGIDYFLFAQTLTLFSGNAGNSNIGVGAQIIYENGANVNTSFIASTGPKLRSSPELYQIVKAANEQSVHANAAPPAPVYQYPDEVILATMLAKFSHYGVKYEEDNAEFIRALDEQRQYKKTCYGAGYLVPQEAATRAQEEAKRAQEAARLHVWQLSEREKQIVRVLEGNEKQASMSLFE